MCPVILNLFQDGPKAKGNASQAARCLTLSGGEELDLFTRLPFPTSCLQSGATKRARQATCAWKPWRQYYHRQRISGVEVGFPASGKLELTVTRWAKRAQIDLHAGKPWICSSRTVSTISRGGAGFRGVLVHGCYPVVLLGIGLVSKPLLMLHLVIEILEPAMWPEPMRSTKETEGAIHVSCPALWGRTLNRSSINGKAPGRSRGEVFSNLTDQRGYFLGASIVRTSRRSNWRGT